MCNKCALLCNKRQLLYPAGYWGGDVDLQKGMSYQETEQRTILFMSMGLTTEKEKSNKRTTRVYTAQSKLLNVLNRQSKEIG